LNLRQLYYFKSVAELKHYTRAAETLYISQSSLSHAIHELEDELGVKLFSRQGRNIKLTRHGEIFYPHVKKTLETLENGISELRDYIDPNRGTVSLLAFSSLDPFVSDAIVRYLSESGRMDVRFQYGHDGFHEIRQRLLDGDIDLAFSTWIDDPRIDGVAIGTHRLVMLVPAGHRLARQETASLKDLEGENFATFDADSQLGVQIREQLRQSGITPKVIMEARQDVVLYGMVSAANSVAITPLPLHGAPYNVRVLNLSDDISRRTMYLLWNKERYMPSEAASFRDFVADSGALFDEYLQHHPEFSR